MIKKALSILGTLMVAFLAALLLYILIKYYYYNHTENCTFIESITLAFKDGGEHIDLIGITIGIFVAILIDRETRHKLTILSSANRNIQNSTEELKQETKQLIEETHKSIDAARRIIDNIPEIFKNIEDILALAEGADKFYYLNEPVSFGRIHSFNKKILSYFREKNNTQIGDYEINLCNNHVVKIAELIIEASKTVADFRMIIKNPDENETPEANSIVSFANDYIGGENKTSGEFEGLIDYEIESGKLGQPNGLYVDNSLTTNIKKIKDVNNENKEVLENSIKRKFLDFNKYVIEACIRNRNENNKQEYLIYNNENCQYQLYLTQNSGKKYSLLIFYHDDEITQSRKLVGFSSDNPHIYKGFEDIYLEKFNKLKSTQK